MPKQLTVLFLIILAMMTSSCGVYRHVYSPQPANNPFFQEKGQSRVAVLYSSASADNGLGQSEENEGIDVQGAYAISNHWAVTSSYFYRREKDVYQKENYATNVSAYHYGRLAYKRNMIDFGTGYFTALDDKKTAVFNIYGGVGFGKFNLDDFLSPDSGALIYPDFYKANMRRYFVQPGFNFFVSDNFAIGFSGRFSVLHYYNNNTSYDGFEIINAYLDRLADKNVSIFEPTMSMEFSAPPMPWLKGFFSGTMVIGWPDHFPSARTLGCSMGLSFDFSKIKKKSTAKN